MSLVSASPAWKDLQTHARNKSGVHLRELLADEKRNASLVAEHNGIYLDYSRQRVDDETMKLLFGKLNEAQLKFV